MAVKEKTVVIGVTGSISAYKAADLASRFTQVGFRVEVIMTEEAVQFITPLTFRNITGRPVVTTMWDLASEFSVEHVALAEAADIVLIAPATANIIAKIASGIADDMLTCTVLATKAPVVIAPAMNDNMWANEITQENVTRLKKRGFSFVGPGYGRLASGKMGLGRLTDLDEIYGVTLQVLGKKKGDLAGKKIVVTAGGTQEAVDPVRCLTNHSSGKMGYAIAIAARNRGAIVTLISGPTALPKPAGIKFVDVKSAEDMLKAVQEATKKADALIMAAAVADFRPAKPSSTKIKRVDIKDLTLYMEKTPDILGQVKGDFIRVGFAAESDDVVNNAVDKVKRKGLDLIVANDITEKDCGFGTDTNRVTIIDSKGKTEELPLLPKSEVADRILDRVGTLLKKR
ncbi:MAG: bifunctional phosphopantothenoylcysteine decarboxylase/phosphopantothenate--cysteine ligase CoaBC [Dehalococcoidia bacterium]|nr:bifunctional phosphopantothenoylcysteine decarboxylase/phosphopantothenate--cysteine ligase CoaBC [Dehalococcoidia bacterium]MDD5495171.1 bifunctional phosphopantothenoylcysteine decarboxylase/phosphopantothenate--cysteine ligase CoaBC [Dehalococcoidia bacterium]